MKDEERIFSEALEGVMKRAKAQNHVVSEEQVQRAFAGMALTDGQMELIYDYLRQHKVGIGEPVDLDEYLTDDDLDYLNMYLEDLGGLPNLPPEEREEIVRNAMEGGEEERQRLVELFLPQVPEVAKLYAGQGVFMEDLIGEGNVALALGVQMLDCLETPSEAEGLLIRLVMDAMEAFIDDAGVMQEEQRELVARARQLYLEARELSESLLRKVTVEELAIETQKDEEEIRSILRTVGGFEEYMEKETEDGTW